LMGMEPCSRVEQRKADAGVNAGLGEWVRQHQYLTAAEEGGSEPSAALLLLWELDHGRQFPGRELWEDRLRAFTRRFKRQLAKEGITWPVSTEERRPWVPGGPTSVITVRNARIRRPGEGEPREWYETFTARWRGLLAFRETEMWHRRVAKRSRDSAEGPGSEVAWRPAKRAREDEAAKLAQTEAARRRARGKERAPPRRSGDTDEEDSADGVRAGHGRASMGAPTGGGSTPG